MIYLFWSVLNAVLLLYFFYLFIGFIFKGNSVFQGKFRFLSITVMTLGVVQMLSAAVPEGKNSDILITEDYDRENGTKLKNILLEDNLTFDIHMSILYSAADNKLTPVSSHSTLTGFVTGFDWDFISIETTPVQEIGRSEFVAVGALEWNLFGFNVYTQKKRFSGNIK